MKRAHTHGRDGELVALRRAVAEVAGGLGGCLVLSGPPGIGKSHLMRAAVDDARVRGVAVAFRAALELDRVAPLISLALPLQRCRPAPLARPWLRHAGQSPYRTIDLLGEAIEGYTADRPLVIAVDDAHWVDELSGLAIRVLVPALASSPVFWLFARRSMPARTPAGDVLDSLLAGDAVHIEVRPLDEAAVAALCAQVVGADVDASVLALAGRCGGNPLLVEQLLTALRSAGQLVVADGLATVSGGELPSTFVATVEQRLRGLSDESRRMLRAGSVFGRPFSVHAVAKLVGVPAVALLPCVEEVVTGDVLVDQDGLLAFRHDLVREAVYSGMPEPVRSHLHVEAAAVTRAEKRSLVEVAGHLTKSGEVGNTEAVAMLRSAARDVAAQAPGTAADWLLHAVSLLGEQDAERAVLSAEAVGLLASAGRLTEAHRLGEATLRTGLAHDTEATVLLGLAEAAKHAGNNRATVEYTDRALRRAGVPQALRARLYAIRAHALFYVDDSVGADRSGSSAHQLGAVVDEFAASVFGLTARSLVAHAQGRFGDALAHARLATDIADRVGGGAAHKHPRIWLGSALVALDRLDEAEAVYREGRQESERLGTAWSTALWHYYYAALLTAKGALDEAVAEAEAGLRIAERLTAYQLVVPLLGTLARLALVRGEQAPAEDLGRRMEKLVETGITAAPEDVTWTIGVLQEASEPPDVAMRTLSPLCDALSDRPVLLGMDPSAGAALVRLATSAGDRPRAAAVVAAARALADRNPDVGSLAAGAAHAGGLYHGDAERLRDAVERFRAVPRPLALASALEDTGAVLARGGQGTAAVGLWREAIGLARGCGALRSDARIRRRIAALGGDPRPRPEPDPATPAGWWSALTPAELRVATLVGKRKTNRAVAQDLYLSPHTVDSHLRHVFAKLHINRRVDLVLLVSRDPPPPIA